MNKFKNTMLLTALLGSASGSLQSTPTRKATWLAYGCFGAGVATVMGAMKLLDRSNPERLVNSQSNAHASNQAECLTFMGGHGLFMQPDQNNQAPRASGWWPATK